MDAAHRRKTITHILEEAKAPVSAAALAREFSVSRQIIAVSYTHLTLPTILLV